VTPTGSRGGAPIAVLACLALVGGWPASASGAEANAREVAALARAAQADPAAVERLRAIDRVDGRPTRLRAALQGDPAQVRERLRALAQGQAPGAPPAAARNARGVARDVLADRRYHAAPLPRPLKGVLDRLAEALGPLGRVLERAFEWVSGRLPGGAFTLWGLIAGLIVAAVAVIGVRAAAARQAAGAQRGTGGPAGGDRVSAAKLRRQADAAERSGDLDEALRLRFRAGLLELHSRELIELRPALTNREILGTVASPTLGGLVAGFEAVAYGGRPAAAEDVRAARDDWPRVLEEAGTR